MRTAGRAALVALAIGLVALSAQANRDPLTTAEANQLRDATDNPPQRIALLVGFAQSRLEQFERLRLDEVQSRDRAADMYSQLEQFAAIIPELNDNLGDVIDLAQSTREAPTGAPPPPKINLPKLLNDVIAAERQMASILHHIDTASDPKDYAGYHFMLQDCVDVTSDSLQDVQQDYANLQAGKKIGGS